MPLSVDEFLDTSGGSIVFNTEAAYFFLTCADYRRHVQGFNNIYCDGVGLAYYSRIRFGKKCRIKNGPDVFGVYLSECVGRNVLILGGSATAHELLCEKYPDFLVRNRVVFNSEMMILEDYPRIAEEITSMGFDDVLIFLGLKKQEYFQYLLHKNGFLGRSIGLGAAIDFLSGKKPRSGWFWRSLGLEWLPRLIKEPRMFPRVVRSFLLFSLIFSEFNNSLRGFLFSKK